MYYFLCLSLQIPTHLVSNMAMKFIKMFKKLFLFVLHISVFQNR